MSQHAVETEKKDHSGSLEFTKAFSSFSVDDLNKVKEFYASTLSLNVSETDEGLELSFENGQSVFIYPKPDHEPATFTVLNLQVDDIEKAVDLLISRKVTFESYEGEMKTDDKGIYRGAEKDNGPNIAWFRDPAGNYLSVIENK